MFAGDSLDMFETGKLCIRLQCLALPIQGWVAVVNMLCAGLGKAKGAIVLSTSRQGTCFLPIVYPLSRFFGAYGIASTQAIADVLTLFLAIPIIKSLKRQIQEAAGQNSPEEAAGETVGNKGEGI